MVLTQKPVVRGVFLADPFRVRFNKDLEQAFEVQQTLEWGGKLYWRNLPDGKRDGPRTTQIRRGAL